MRTGILATLILSPLMVHAQAITPAQPQAATKAVLLAAATPEDRPTSTDHPIRVSTGVVAPKLIHTVEVQQTRLGAPIGDLRTAMVSLVVDASGKPSNVKLVQPGSPYLNQGILDAVSQFRFRPGTVSGQTIAMPLNLRISVQQPVE